MSELSWLLDLLLNHKISHACKQHVAERIAQVEQSLRPNHIAPKIINGAVQSASTLALMEKHGESVPRGTLCGTPAIEAPQTAGIAAANPATAQAIESRNQAIRAAQLGKPEPGRTSPRKF